MRQESSEGVALRLLVHLLIISATKLTMDDDGKRVTLSTIDADDQKKIQTFAFTVYIF